MKPAKSLLPLRPRVMLPERPRPAATHPWKKFDSVGYFATRVKRKLRERRDDCAEAPEYPGADEVAQAVRALGCGDDESGG